jgi:hypothetical protein
MVDDMSKRKKLSSREAAAALIRLYEFYDEKLDLDAPPDDTALGVLWLAVLDRLVSVPHKRGRPVGSRTKNPATVLPQSAADRKRKERARKWNAAVLKFLSEA